MAAFRYVEPIDIDEVIGILAGEAGGAHLIAGGTALVPLLKTGYVQPAVVVGLRRVTGLDLLERRGDVLSIGALATHTAVATSPVVRSGWPLLALACSAVGTIRIRNQGTLGGNVVHADPSQDPPPALLVLDARVRIRGSTGERSLPIRDVFIDYFATDLLPDEVLVGLEIDLPPPGRRETYVKFLPRSQDDYATVAVAAMATTTADGRLRDVRIALGGVGPTPLRLPGPEAVLEGEIPTIAAIRDAAAQVDVAIDPLDDARGSATYKRAMARVWLERALGDVCSVPVA